MNTLQTLQTLRRYESRNILFAEADGSWPIVWERARGSEVWDAEGRRYLDLTAAFGVAAAGHANPAVVRAGQRQMGRLLHVMGDVHPHARKAELARELSRITFERWTQTGAEGASPKEPRKTPRPRRGETLPAPGQPQHGKTVFCNSGFEAVEAALKTALLATGRRGVVAFEGAYHGLGYGALNATHRGLFRGPFQAQLGRFGRFVPFPTRAEELQTTSRQLSRLLEGWPAGAVLVEPVQGRGGIRVPPADFLALLRRHCDQAGALLIVDEVYTGFGRTGRWFACEHSGVVPDLICLGKALTGGFPLSACVGRSAIMDAAWPVSQGEAIHTSTFLGHPVGCAMALAQIEEIRRRGLVERSTVLGKTLLRDLSRLAEFHAGLRATARGLGLMAGLELVTARGQPATREALAAIKAMLGRGFILLPEGEHSNVISFTPPLTIGERALERAVAALGEVLR